MNECHRCSVEHDDPVLDREIELTAIARCVHHVREGSNHSSGCMANGYGCFLSVRYLFIVVLVVYTSPYFSTP